VEYLRSVLAGALLLLLSSYFGVYLGYWAKPQPRRRSHLLTTLYIILVILY
jgi:hypothetical protein